jgi:secreted trypsin-like serine protease
MVGGAGPASDAEGGASAVLIVGSRGNSCTGAAVARDLVLTAAHCVAPGADYKLVEFDSARRPTLKDVREVVRHPQFSLAALSGHRASADVALVKLAAPLPARFVPARLSALPAPTQPGGGFLVAGFGVTVRGDGKSGGTLRAAQLAATGRPGGLQLRLVDPGTRGERAGLGACTGDSGAPVFAEDGGAPAIVGVVSWSTGPGNAAGCGGLTGVTPLARYRDWIVQTARRLGSPLE